MYVYMYVCIYRYIYIYMCVYVCVCVCWCVYACACLCLTVCINVYCGCVYMCIYLYFFVSFSIYLYIYNGRCLSILIDKYTIFLMCMHLAFMYSYLEKNTLYIPFGTLNDFHLLMLTLFIIDLLILIYSIYICIKCINILV